MTPESSIERASVPNYAPTHLSADMHRASQAIPTSEPQASHHTYFNGMGAEALAATGHRLYEDHSTHSTRIGTNIVIFDMPKSPNIVRRTISRITGR
jgi:hypothetical protein